MKESAINALKKIQSLTAKVCQGCDHEGNNYRCCDKEFHFHKGKKFEPIEDWRKK